jgi:Ribosomal protein S21
VSAEDLAGPKFLGFNFFPPLFFGFSIAMWPYSRKSAFPCGSPDAIGWPWKDLKTRHVLQCRRPAQTDGFKEEQRVQILVRDNNVDQALRVLKKKMQREGGSAR